MQPNIDTVRATLGELAAMAAECDRAEREILARATERLEAVEKQIELARVAALAGGDTDQKTFEDLVNERGVLHVVIARAKQTLSRA